MRAIALPGNEDGDPRFLEQFRALRAKFEYKAETLKLKVVAMTSAIAGEGKTISCANLAINLASSGRKKVLLIDVDLRKSDLAGALHISPLPGLSEYLIGSAAVEGIVRNSVVPGMQVIPGGAKITAPADLLAGERFRGFLAAIRSRFDIVLLDTPPILPVADTLGLRNQVDGFIFVFRAGFTPYTMLKQAVEEIGETNILGVVLNGVEPQSCKYYERYYGKYYREIRKGKETT
ncbi:CpsD/CapB family tyrosine-protein kinase [Candidatus Poribacteria bacterium]|nr:CpsD/CapB family tyrosine-protein kinase [Candidatus Poribacteria bacterium]